MKEIANAISEIAKTSSRIEKEALLKKHANVSGFKEILHFIFNPYQRTGIGKAKLGKVPTYPSLVSPITTWQEAIAYFSQNCTGRDEDIAIAVYFINNQDTDAERELAMAIVTKTLTIGVTETTLNKVYGASFIPKIGVMLGSKWEDFKDKVKGPFIVTEKLDGQRRILVKENGKVSFYSRSGIPDEGLVEIEAEARFLPDNCVYDGELLAIGKFADSIALRQATNSLASRSGEKTGLEFHIFDMITVDDFKTGRSDAALHRKILLASIMDDPSIIHLVETQEEADSFRQEFGHISGRFKLIKAVPILGVAHDEYGVREFANPIWSSNREGVMLNTFHGEYEIKRSKNLLKVKLTKELTLKVVGQQEGEGANKGKLGALLLDYKGQVVGCGTGFTSEQREKFWKDTIIDKWVEIETFGESVDNSTGTVSLNCPVFKRVVGDKSE